MTQYHGVQHGLFHVTTNAKKRNPWLTIDGVPECIVDNLRMSKYLYGAKVHAFCILPDHMHMIVTSGEKGLSAFMHSFKRNSMRDIRQMNRSRSGGSRSSATEEIFWQKGFHDERIRTLDQRDAALSYVRGNAMRHGLVSTMDEWPWHSGRYPEMIDPVDIWW